MDPRKTVLYSLTEVDPSEEMREVEALTDPVEEQRDLKARKILSHEWAHSPRPNPGEEELKMRTESDRL